MRAVIQRVREAHVDVGEERVGTIGPGLMVLVAAGDDDGPQDAAYMARKIAELRIFVDEEGKMNRSVEDTGGSVLLISQFTLYGDCRKGRRPSFVHAMMPESAASLFNEVVEGLKARQIPVETGRFGAMMDVHLVNHGPVTLLVDSRKEF